MELYILYLKSFIGVFLFETPIAPTSSATIMEQYPWLTSLPSLCCIALLGMLSHFFKKNIKGETLTDIRGFFRDNFKSTLVATITTLITTIGYVTALGTGQAADIVTVFFLGYTFDSAFNKWDSQK